jgi:hypothetical protein
MLSLERLRNLWPTNVELQDEDEGWKDVDLSIGMDTAATHPDRPGTPGVRSGPETARRAAPVPSTHSALF